MNRPPPHQPRRCAISRPRSLSGTPYSLDEPVAKIIDVFICKLRKKLANASMGQNYIETIWGRGYVLREPTENVAKISA